MPFGFGRRRKGGSHHGRGRGGGRRRKDFRQGRPENCICPVCKTIVPHQQGLPCFKMMCPQCGSPMTRQFIVPDSP